jgi:acyl carrier protein
MQSDPEPVTTSSNRPNAEAIQAFIVSKLAEALKIDPTEVDIRVPFTSYGLDSIVAFSIIGDLAAWLQCDLESTLLWEFPTIEALAQFLAADAAPACEAG